MNKTNIEEEFLNALRNRKMKKSDLLKKISDVLRIEKESASRRLNGRVQFSLREIGLLAEDMNISLDALIHKKNHFQWTPIAYQSPMSCSSMDDLYSFIIANLNHVAKMIPGPGEFGSVIHALPLEFCMHNPVLLKFVFFKWGYYFIGTKEFYNYSTWTVPDKLLNIKDKIEPILNNMVRRFYIWDDSLISRTANEVENFHKMGIISTAEKNTIREELKNVLNNIEQNIRGAHDSIENDMEITFYASMISIGITCTYYSSNEKNCTAFQTDFLSSGFDDSYENFLKTKEWIYSLCNISTLLSSSAHLERRLFFEKQQKIVDDILGVKNG